MSDEIKTNEDILTEEEEPARKIVIYVDDVNFSLLTVKDILKKHYEVYPAQSVAIMFKILKQLGEFRGVKPDLILLDVNMPDVNGFDAIQQLKTDARYKNIPVVFLTAQSDKDSIFMGLNLGAVAFVNKPFTSSSLLEHIGKVLNPGDGEKPQNPFEELMGSEKETEKPVVLAVDDVALMLMTIQSALRDMCKVYMLTKPQEMESLLYRIKPDLFLLDHNMPGLSGFDLVPIIRNFPQHKETPIIFVTADGTHENMIKAAGCGACDFIVKPIKTALLRERVAKYVKIKTDDDDSSAGDAGEEYYT